VLATPQPIKIPLKSATLFETLEIPETLGAIWKRHEGDQDAPLVYILQDAHVVEDAQRNLEAMVHYLHKEAGVQLIGLEGGTGRLDTLYYQSFPNQDKLRHSLLNYQATGELSGPELAAVFGSRQLTFKGIEDWDLYQTNYVAYLRASLMFDAIDGAVESAQINLNQKSAAVLSHDLLEWMIQKQQVTSSADGFARVLRFLAEKLMTWDIDLASLRADFPLVAQVLSLISAEQNLNHDSISKRVDVLISEFRSQYWDQLLRQTRNTLQGQLQAYHTGRLSALEMLRGLKSAAEVSDLLFSVSPDLSALLELYAAVDKARDSRLFDEWERCLIWIEDKLADSERARALLRDYRHLERTRALGHLEITRPHLDAYLAEIGESQQMIVDPDLLKPALAFYEAALKRDHKMFETFNQEMLHLAQTRAAVILGGFHTKGFEALLEAKGYSYIVVGPRMLSTTGEEFYTDRMKQAFSYESEQTGSPYSDFATHLTKELLRDVPRGEVPKELKQWRDEIIRKLAQEGRILEASRYTAFLDKAISDHRDSFKQSLLENTSLSEIRSHFSEALREVAESSTERLWNQFKAEGDEFTRGWRGLIAEGQDSLANRKVLWDTALKTQSAGMAIRRMAFIQGLRLTNTRLVDVLRSQDFETLVPELPLADRRTLLRALRNLIQGGDQRGSQLDAQVLLGAVTELNSLAAAARVDGIRGNTIQEVERSLSQLIADLMNHLSAETREALTQQALAKVLLDGLEADPTAELSPSKQLVFETGSPPTEFVAASLGDAEAILNFDDLRANVDMAPKAKLAKMIRRAWDIIPDTRSDTALLITKLRETDAALLESILNYLNSPGSATAIASLSNHLQREAQQVLHYTNEDIFAEMLDDFSTHYKGKWIVAIDGVPDAGKSTLWRAIREKQVPLGTLYEEMTFIEGDKQLDKWYVNVMQDKRVPEKFSERVFSDIALDELLTALVRDHPRPDGLEGDARSQVKRMLESRTSLEFIALYLSAIPDRIVVYNAGASHNFMAQYVIDNSDFPYRKVMLVKVKVAADGERTLDVQVTHSGQNKLEAPEIETVRAALPELANHMLRIAMAVKASGVEGILLSGNSASLTRMLFTRAWHGLFADFPLPQIYEFDGEDNSMLYKQFGEPSDVAEYEYLEDIRFVLESKHSLNSGIPLKNLLGQPLLFLDDVALTGRKNLLLRSVFQALEIPNIKHAVLVSAPEALEVTEFDLTGLSSDELAEAWWEFAKDYGLISSATLAPRTFEEYHITRILEELAAAIDYNAVGFGSSLGVLGTESQLKYRAEVMRLFASARISQPAFLETIQTLTIIPNISADGGRALFNLFRDLATDEETLTSEESFSRAEELRLQYASGPTGPRYGNVSWHDIYTNGSSWRDIYYSVLTRFGARLERISRAEDMTPEALEKLLSIGKDLNALEQLQQSLMPLVREKQDAETFIELNPLLTIDYEAESVIRELDELRARVQSGMDLGEELGLLLSDIKANYQTYRNPYLLPLKVSLVAWLKEVASDKWAVSLRSIVQSRIEDIDKTLPPKNEHELFPDYTDKDAPKVTILIRMHNKLNDPDSDARRENMRENLRSLTTLNYPRAKLEVSVVDDGSPDRTFAQALKTEFPWVRVLQASQNSGNTGATNIGLRDALSRGAEHVLLLDDDTYVPDAKLLTKLVRTSELPNAGFVGARLITQSNQQWRPEKFHTFPHYYGDKVRSRQETDAYQEIDFGTGATVLAPRHVLDRVGLMDERFFLYHEETDWQARAESVALQNMAAKTTRVVHRQIGGSTVRPGALYLLTRNFFLYMLNHTSGFHYLKQITRTMGWAAYYAVWDAKVSSLRQRWVLIKAFLRGIRDGMLKRWYQVPEGINAKVLKVPLPSEEASSLGAYDDFFALLTNMSGMEPLKHLHSYLPTDTAPKTVEQDGQRLIVSARAQREMEKLDNFARDRQIVAEIVGYGLTRDVDDETVEVVDFITPDPNKVYVIAEGLFINALTAKLMPAMVESGSLELQAHGDTVRVVSSNPELSFDIDSINWEVTVGKPIRGLFKNELPKDFEQMLDLLKQNGPMRVPNNWEIVTAGRTTWYSGAFIERVQNEAEARDLKMDYSMHYHPVLKEINQHYAEESFQNRLAYYDVLLMPSTGDLVSSHSTKTRWFEIRAVGSPRDIEAKEDTTSRFYDMRLFDLYANQLRGALRQLMSLNPTTTTPEDYFDLLKPFRDARDVFVSKALPFNNLISYILGSDTVESMREELRLDGAIDSLQKLILRTLINRESEARLPTFTLTFLRNLYDSQFIDLYQRVMQIYKAGGPSAKQIDAYLSKHRLWNSLLTDVGPEEIRMKANQLRQLLQRPEYASFQLMQSGLPEGIETEARTAAFSLGQVSPEAENRIAGNQTVPGIPLKQAWMSPLWGQHPFDLVVESFYEIMPASLALRMVNLLMSLFEAIVQESLFRVFLPFVLTLILGPEFFVGALVLQALVFGMVSHRRLDAGLVVPILMGLGLGAATRLPGIGMAAPFVFSAAYFYLTRPYRQVIPKSKIRKLMFSSIDAAKQTHRRAVGSLAGYAPTEIVHVKRDDIVAHLQALLRRAKLLQGDAVESHLLSVMEAEARRDVTRQYLDKDLKSGKYYVLAQALIAIILEGGTDELDEYLPALLRVYNLAAKYEERSFGRELVQSFLGLFSIVMQRSEYDFQILLQNMRTHLDAAVIDQLLNHNDFRQWSKKLSRIQRHPTKAPYARDVLGAEAYGVSRRMPLFVMSLLAQDREFLRELIEDEKQSPILRVLALGYAAGNFETDKTSEYLFDSQTLEGWVENLRPHWAKMLNRYHIFHRTIPEWSRDEAAPYSLFIRAQTVALALNLRQHFAKDNLIIGPGINYRNILTQAVYNSGIAYLEYDPAGANAHSDLTLNLLALKEYDIKRFFSTQGHEVGHYWGSETLEVHDALAQSAAHKYKPTHSNYRYFADAVSELRADVMLNVVRQMIGLQPWRVHEDIDSPYVNEGHRVARRALHSFIRSHVAQELDWHLIWAALHELLRPVYEQTLRVREAAQFETIEARDESLWVQLRDALPNELEQLGTHKARLKYSDTGDLPRLEIGRQMVLEAWLERAFKRSKVMAQDLKKRDAGASLGKEEDLEKLRLQLVALNQEIQERFTRIPAGAQPHHVYEDLDHPGRLAKRFQALQGLSPVDAPTQELTNGLIQYGEHKEAMLKIEAAIKLEFAGELEPALTHYREALQKLTSIESDLIPEQAQRVAYDEIYLNEALNRIDGYTRPIDKSIAGMDDSVAIDDLKPYLKFVMPFRPEAEQYIIRARFYTPEIAVFVLSTKENDNKQETVLIFETEGLDKYHFAGSIDYAYQEFKVATPGNIVSYRHTTIPDRKGVVTRAIALLLRNQYLTYWVSEPAEYSTDSSRKVFTDRLNARVYRDIRIHHDPEQNRYFASLRPLEFGQLFTYNNTEQTRNIRAKMLELKDLGGGELARLVNASFKMIAEESVVVAQAAYVIAQDRQWDAIIDFIARKYNGLLQAVSNLEAATLIDNTALDRYRVPIIEHWRAIKAYEGELARMLEVDVPKSLSMITRMKEIYNESRELSLKLEELWIKWERAVKVSPQHLAELEQIKSVTQTRINELNAVWLDAGSIFSYLLNDRSIEYKPAVSYADLTPGDFIKDTNDSSTINVVSGFIADGDQTLGVMARGTLLKGAQKTIPLKRILRILPHADAQSLGVRLESIERREDASLSLEPLKVSLEREQSSISRLLGLHFDSERFNVLLETANPEDVATYLANLAGTRLAELSQELEAERSQQVEKLDALTVALDLLLSPVLEADLATLLQKSLHAALFGPRDIERLAVRLRLLTVWQAARRYSYLEAEARVDLPRLRKVQQSLDTEILKWLTQAPRARVIFAINDPRGNSVIPRVLNKFQKAIERVVILHLKGHAPKLNRSEWTIPITLQGYSTRGNNADRQLEQFHALEEPVYAFSSPVEFGETFLKKLDSIMVDLQTIAGAELQEAVYSTAILMIMKLAAMGREQRQRFLDKPELLLDYFSRDDAFNSLPELAFFELNGRMLQIRMDQFIVQLAARELVEAAA